MKLQLPLFFLNQKIRVSEKFIFGIYELAQ
ncbi:hypothetical protein C8D83_101151 [Halothiobacillus neapolitanus]|jgi:hypothetical protein|nr:hypothetical protein C8D83_101151 [Halothiobacillus neapolitanus]